MRTIDNWIGKMRGFGCCPNCGDSYAWKTTAGLPYEDKQGGLASQEDGTIIINVGLQKSVLICTECLYEPKRLDVKRITGALKKSGWKQSDIEKVESVITNLQTMP